MMLLFFVSVAALVLVVCGICDSECKAASQLLSDCSLPPISAAWDWGTGDPTVRNITGVPDLSLYYTHAGPITLHIANYSQAQCFCLDGRFAVPECSNCLAVNAVDDFKRAILVNQIEDDCEAFGYYDNSNFSYPSMTLENMPQETRAPDGDLGGNTCDDTCAVIHGQIEDCSLTRLDAQWPPQVDVLEHRQPRLLLNRTAAECLCTLPLLRRGIACQYCLRVTDAGSDDLVPVAWERVSDYMLECHEMGYWTDNQFVTADLALENPTKTGSASPSPTENAAAELGQALELTTAAFLCTIFLL